jgi:UDP-N-acetyl-D-glucosamine dehydrogenase
MNFYSALSYKIRKKTAKIGIIGLGYVGLPLALQFAKKKFKVVGFDKDINKISLLKKDKSYIKHISNDLLKKYKKRINFEKSFQEIITTDVIILCLPTPTTDNLQPDLSYIKKTLENIRYFLSEGQIIILESSTYPGSTREIILPYLKNFLIGKNFFLGYSPEREDPNNKKYSLETIPKICSGFTNNCLNITKNLYSKILKKVVSVSNLETAEFVKLYENIYRSVNIGLVNEMKMIANKLSLNIYEIIKAAKTKPFGFQAFYPGPGVGGHCIPVDPYYLSWIANKNNIKTNLIYHAGKINSYMPNWIISEAFKKKKIEKVLIIGVAYKKDLDDTRESPSIDFINILNKKKISVDIHDPNVKMLKSRKLKKNYTSKILNSKMLKKYDCIIICTDHSNVDYSLIKKNAKLIVDTRNVFNDQTNKILKL